jgi:predicted Holliday junction resolvase-like endonuclease
MVDQVEFFGIISAVLFIIIIAVVLLYERRTARLLVAVEREKTSVRDQSVTLANKLFDEWSHTTLDGVKNQITESIKKEFEAQLETWKKQEEEKIRKDAIQKSINTLLGKIGEEFSPVLLSTKFGINLKDFRHLGTPVDFVAFKGLSDDTEDVEVVFLEIKSGKSYNLIARERKIRDAIDQKRVSYEIVNLSDIINDAKNELKL